MYCGSESGVAIHESFHHLALLNLPLHSTMLSDKHLSDQIPTLQAISLLSITHQDYQRDYTVCRDTGSDLMSTKHGQTPLHITALSTGNLGLVL